MRHLLTLTIALTLLAGCAGRQATAPTAAPQPSAAATTTAPLNDTPVPSGAPTSGPAAPLDLAAARVGIQATIDDYARAYATGDAELLRSTVDQSNAPFRRLVQERFEMTQASALSSADSFTMKVVALEPRELGFVQAHVERDGWLRYDWLFREVDGRWLLSEPSEKQLGERIEIESEHFTFHTYAWAEPTNDKLVELMERARAQVVERLGKGPDGKYNIYIRPIFGFTPPASAGAIAWYRSAARPRGDRIDVYAPGSYVYGGYDASASWEADLYTTLVHEYTHLVNQRSFMPIAEMRDWMFEGLAEYVSDSQRAEEVSAAVRANKIIPIVDPAGGVNPQDLDHLYILERDRSLAYGLSYALVAYIVQEHGGLEAFWALAEAMGETPGTGVVRYDGAMRATLGVSYEQFDAGWRAWLKQNY